MKHPHRQRTRDIAPTHRRQRGVAAVMFGIAILAFMTMVMFGFNVGQLYFAQQDLQRQAALAALSGAQAASGCRTGLGPIPGIYGVPGNTAAVTAAVNFSILTNAGPDNPFQVIPPSVELGTIMSTNYKQFVPLADGDIGIDAVRVRLSRTKPTLIAAALFSAQDATLMTAAATARAGNTATFTVGTSPISFVPDQVSQLNQLLGQVFGTPVFVSQFSYNQLANAQISLANLMSAAGVSDLDGLLGINTSLAGAIGILGNALNKSGNGLAAVTANILALQARGAPSSSVNIGDVLGTVVGTTLNSDSSDAASVIPFVKGSDFLLALAQDAAAQRPQGYQINAGFISLLPGPDKLSVTLHVISPPVLAVGPVGTEGRNSQLQLRIRQQSGLWSELLGRYQKNGYDLNLANGTGTLTNLTCPTATNAMPSANVAVASNTMEWRYGSFAGDLGPNNPDPDLTGGTLFRQSAPFSSVPLYEVTVDGPVTATEGSAINGSSGALNTFGVPTNTVPPSKPGLLFRSPIGQNVFTTGTAKTFGSYLPSLLSGTTANRHTYINGKEVLTAFNDAVNAFNTNAVEPIGNLMDSVVDPTLAALGIKRGLVQINLQSITISSPVIESFCNPDKPLAPGAPAC